MAALPHAYTAHVRLWLILRLKRARCVHTPPAQLSTAFRFPSPPRRRPQALPITPAKCSRAAANEFVGEQTRPLGFPPRFGPGSPWVCTEARVALRGRHKGGGERLRAPSVACHPLCLAAQAASALVNAGARHVDELARLGTRARVALGQRDVAVDVLDQPLRRRLRGSLSSLRPTLRRATH